MNIDLLHELLSVDSPSGDEQRMADWLTGWIGNNVPDADIVRLRDNLIVTRGESPQVAIFAHIDTIGFTVGYDGKVVPIGSPDCKAADRVRSIGGSGGVGQLEKSGKHDLSVVGLEVSPGDRIVYADGPVQDGSRLRSRYLDNRGGIWAALEALGRCERIAVAFTTGEEVGACGARVCARYLWDTLGIGRALVSDITWDTQHVHCGKGVAISRRDSLVPPQRFVERVLALAEGSGIPYQVEIESEGGSDGSGIEYSGCPLDWIFVGAPEKRPHTPTEEVDLHDLEAMRDMLVYLVDKLSVS